MGGSSLLRSPLRLRPIIRPSRRIHRSSNSPSPSPSSSSAAPPVSASFVARVRSRAAPEEPAGLSVFGSAPSEEEAEAALSALKQVFIQYSLSETSREETPSPITGIPIPSETSTAPITGIPNPSETSSAPITGIPIPSETSSAPITGISIPPESSTAPITGIPIPPITGISIPSESSMENLSTNQSNENSNPADLRLSRSNSTGLSRIRNSLNLLNKNPSIQKLVLSLSTDKAVWDAIMKNEAVQELHNCIIQAGKNEPLAFIGQDSFMPSILNWVIENAKNKIVELIDQISELLSALFKANGSDETVSILNDVVKNSFMLTVMVLLVVIVSRLQIDTQ